MFGAYLCQHDLGVLEVGQHGLNVGFIGGSGEEPPSEPLHALHRAGRQLVLQGDDAAKECV